jgi:hypothetical protein
MFVEDTDDDGDRLEEGVEQGDSEAIEEDGKNEGDVGCSKVGKAV